MRLVYGDRSDIGQNRGTAWTTEPTLTASDRHAFQCRVAKSIVGYGSTSRSRTAAGDVDRFRLPIEDRAGLLILATPIDVGSLHCPAYYLDIWSDCLD